MPSEAEKLAAKLEKLHATIAGGAGVSWSMGNDYAVRYDAATGEPYTTRVPANLTTSSEKLRAIVDLYTLLPEIAAAIRSLIPEAGHGE